jgi:hypothetical protein
MTNQLKFGGAIDGKKKLNTQEILAPCDRNVPAYNLVMGV